MKRALTTLLVLWSATAGAGLKVMPFTPRYVEWYDEECPETVEGWRHVRYSIARDFSDPGTTRIPFDRGRERGAFLAYAWLDKCLRKPSVLRMLEKHPRVAACLEPLSDYLGFYRTQFPLHRGKEGISRLGFAVADDRYNEEAKKHTPVPEELADATFLEYLSRLEDVPKAFEYLHRANRKREQAKFPPFRFLVFESPIPSKDAAKSRAKLLVHVPKEFEAPERFFSFSLPNEKNKKSEEATAISLAEDGVYFSEYWRRRKDRVYGLQRYREMKGPTCLSCHKSGMPLPIRPEPSTEPYQNIYREYSFWADDRETLAAINAAITNRPRLRAKYDPSPQVGVGLGAVEPTFRTEALFAACGGKRLERRLARVPASVRAAERTGIYRRVSSAMTCTRCHDGSALPVLSPPFREVLRHFVADGGMPPETDLRPFERALLARCLDDEFWGYRDPKTRAYVPGSLMEFLLSESCVPEETSAIEEVR